MPPAEDERVAFPPGRVPERPNGTVSKTVVPWGTVGSNPTPSASENTGRDVVSPGSPLRWRLRGRKERKERTAVMRKERHRLEVREIRRLRRELRRATARRRRRRLLLAAALGGAAMAVRSRLPKPPPGGGTVVLTDAQPGLLANMLGEMFKAVMRDPAKKATADMMHLSIAVEDLGNPELAATITFKGSDVSIKSGADRGADIYVAMELALLMSLAQAPRGPEIVEWFREGEGRKIIDALREKRIRIRGLHRHPLQMACFARLMAPGGRGK